MNYYAISCDGDWRRCASREEAWEFIETQWCRACVEEHALHPAYSPGCDAEWEVVSDGELNEYAIPLDPLKEIKGGPMKRKGWELRRRGWGVSFLRHAGVLSFWVGDRNLYLGVSRQYWFWGVDREWSFWLGAGPFFLYISEA